MGTVIPSLVAMRGALVVVAACVAGLAAAADCNGNGILKDGACVCDTGYKAPDCLKMECAGHGHEVRIEGSEPKCLCNPGYFGSDCSKEECNGHGRAEKGVCVCEDGFSGRECDIECNNHGQATTGGCVCDPEYTGKFCDKLKRLPVPVLPHLSKISGQGTCENLKVSGATNALTIEGDTATLSSKASLKFLPQGEAGVNAVNNAFTSLGGAEAPAVKFKTVTVKMPLVGGTAHADLGLTGDRIVSISDMVVTRNQKGDTMLHSETNPMAGKAYYNWWATGKRMFVFRSNPKSLFDTAVVKFAIFYKSKHVDKVADAAAAAPVATKKTGSIVKLTLEVDSSKFSTTDFVSEFATAADVDSARMKVVGTTPNGEETVVDVKNMNEAGKEAASDIAAKVKQSFTKKTLRLSMPVKAVDTPAPGEVTKTVKKNVVLSIPLKGYDVKANKVALEDAVKTDVALAIGVDKTKITVNEVASKADAANVDMTIEGGEPEKVAGLPKGVKFDTVEGTAAVSVPADGVKAVGVAEQAKEKVAADAAKSIAAFQTAYDTAKAKDDTAQGELKKCKEQKGAANCKDQESTATSTATALGTASAALNMANAKAELEKAQKEGDAAAIAAAREKLEAAEGEAATAAANEKVEALKTNAATGGNASTAEITAAISTAVASDVKASASTAATIKARCDAIKATVPANQTAIAACTAELEAAQSATKAAAATAGADATNSTAALPKTTKGR